MPTLLDVIQMGALGEKETAQLKQALMIKTAGAASDTDPVGPNFDHLSISEIDQLLQCDFDTLLIATMAFEISMGKDSYSIEKFSPSAGYEPWLIGNGWNDFAARGVAKVLLRHGNRIAMESKWIPDVAEAVRFLSRPRRNKPAVLRRVVFLLEAWEQTSIIENVFYEMGLDVFAFINLLKSVAETREVDHRLAAMAAAVAPHLPTRRGPKISAASAAHEFLLENADKSMKLGAYTWNEIEKNFTDLATMATRREFNECEFDPRPAYRRVKARRKK